MRLQGQGEAGINGGPYGDLYIIFVVEPSKIFERDGADIYYEQPISFVHGDVDMKIPAETQTGTVFRLRGKGAPRLRGKGNGDEKVTVTIETPKKLNKKQKLALKAFAEASGFKPANEKGSFFDRLKNL